MCQLKKKISRGDLGKNCLNRGLRQITGNLHCIIEPHIRGGLNGDFFDEERIGPQHDFHHVFIGDKTAQFRFFVIC